MTLIIPKRFEYLTLTKKIPYKDTFLKTVYLIHLIHHFVYRYSFKKNEVNLSSKLLQQNYGMEYLRYVEYLVENDFIVKSGNYSAEHHFCNKYKLIEMIDEVVIYHPTDFLFNKKVRKRKEDKLKKVKQIETPIPKEIRKKLITDLQSITIDFESSLKLIDDEITDNRRKYLKNLIMINKIRDNDIYWKFDKYTRFHSSFTNIKKDIRKNYLRIDGEPVCEIDIPTSQPFFLSQILKQERLISKNDEVTKFINIVENEDIYIYFLEKHPSIFKDRDAVKPMIYKCLFKRYKKLNEYHELFRSEFPFIFDYLESYYVNNGEPLWKTLQRMESYFIFNIVYPEIIARFKDINLYYSQTQNSTKADAFGIGEQKIVFREGDMIVGFPA